jgi:hypothetical protein
MQQFKMFEWEILVKTIPEADRECYYYLYKKKIGGVE